MMYKDIHFYTTSSHIKYMKEVEHLNDIDIGKVLKEYWNCKNLEVVSILEHYEKEYSNE